MWSDTVRLLVAEDDRGLRSVLTRSLREQGYIVDAVDNGDDALALMVEYDYAAVVLDWRMPGLTGVEVIAAARKRDLAVPVLMLTARDASGDRIAGLDAGADDYLVKPFDLGELFARVRALMRRPRNGAAPLLRHGTIELDPSVREVRRAGDLVPLTATEFAILELLLRRAPTVVSRRAIAQHVWPDELDPVGSNTIDVHIARLRAKLGDADVRVVTVRGAGFRLAG
jgi:DNA-binding response OmpR family regulator